MSDDIEITLFLEQAGFVEPASAERAADVLISAGLTSGRKEHMAADKRERAAEALRASLIGVCGDDRCRFRAGSDTEREVVVVTETACEVCGGDEYRRSPARHAAGSDELILAVARLLADRPVGNGRRLRYLRDELDRLFGIEVDRRALSSLSEEHPDIFGRSNDELCLLVGVTQVPSILAESSFIAEPTPEPATPATDRSAEDRPALATPAHQEQVPVPVDLTNQIVRAMEIVLSLVSASSGPATKPATAPAAKSVSVAKAAGTASPSDPSASPPPVAPAAPAPMVGHDEEIRRYGEFLRAYSQIEGEMRRRAGVEISERLVGVALLNEAASRDPLVASYFSDISLLSQYRNLLMHVDFAGRPLAIPRPELIDRAKQVARVLGNRGRAIDHATEPLIVDADGRAHTAVRALLASGHSVAVVSGSDGVKGVISERSALRWALGLLEQDMLREQTAADLLEAAPLRYVSSGSNLGQLVGELRLAAQAKEPRTVCLVSTDGTAAGRIRGFATLADLPALECSLEG